MKRQAMTLSGLGLMAVLSGCSFFLEDTYSSVTLHTVAPVVEDSSYITVESYHELVNALAYYVTEYAEAGQIRFLEYNKDEAKEDLSRAVSEVMTETAMGSYAVSTIQWETNSIMGYLEADVQITYHKTREEVEEIVPVTGTTSIVRAVSQGLTDRGERVTVTTSWANNDRSQIPAILQRAYESAVASLVEIPQVYTTFYPKEGSWRILELEFHYSLSPETREGRLTALAEVLDKTTSPLWSQEDEDYFASLYRAVSEKATLSTTGDTPYHVLVEGTGSHRGFALAYLALCQEMALDCEVVEGTLLGEVHHWNLITTETGETYHLDCSRGEEGRIYFSDSQMEAMGYVWQKSAYLEAVDGDYPSIEM